jgi:hypothetical protein
MTLRFRITWPNAHHPLLADQHAAVTLAADGAALTPLTKTVGERVFEVPPGATKLDLRAIFSPSLPDALGASAHQETVLDVAQSYDVVAGGTAVQPIDQASYLGPHPLVDTVQAANVHGAVHARLATTFVDITPFMPHYGEHWNYYETRRTNQTNVALRALGCTEGGQGPLIWFASIPEACVVPPSHEISCIVFFRPAIGTAYTRVDQKHPIYSLARYLLRPLPPVTPDTRTDDGEPLLFCRRQWLDGDPFTTVVLYRLREGRWTLALEATVRGYDLDRGETADLQIWIAGDQLLLLGSKCALPNRPGSMSARICEHAGSYRLRDGELLRLAPQPRCAAGLTPPPPTPHRREWPPPAAIPWYYGPSPPPLPPSTGLAHACPLRTEAD